VIGGHTRRAAVGLFGTAALQQALQQTLLQAVATSVDSTVVDSPLPGGIAHVVRFLLNVVPAWMQIGGLVAAVALCVAFLVMLARRRSRIRTWITTRDRGLKLALAVGASLLVIGVASAGGATWRYTQHDNAFCTGCHVMNTAYQRFAQPDNKHRELSCHNCHQQSVFASARQVYLWVAERPEKIGPHAKVPNDVCASCHVTGDTAKWQRIAATAGHRVHFESDSASLKNLQCVTCHGAEVHRFKPVRETCGQSGCHDLDRKTIVLGRMATQTVRHCTTCHEFTLEVPTFVPRDSARGVLRPGGDQCFGCHEMRAVLADYDPARDPHKGKCGSCHNPHTQHAPIEAAQTCTNAGCHANWREGTFHSGATHRRVAERCLMCHAPHRAKVDPSDCQGCHANVRARTPLRPPVAFDTAAALRRSRLPPRDTTPVPNDQPNGAVTRGSHDDSAAAPTDPDPAPSDDGLTTSGDDAAPIHHAAEPQLNVTPAQGADSFPHPRHASIACITCHQTGGGHGKLTFERPRGCRLCHHQDPGQERCASCHRIEQYGRPMQRSVTIAVRDHEPRARTVVFEHARHSSRRCTECHATPVTLEPTTTKAQCVDCHEEHHGPARVCGSCHRLDDPRVAHTSPTIAHQQCDACHKPDVVARLTPTRNLCSTCHPTNRSEHYEPRECTTCHFLMEPMMYRAHLRGGAGI
jgi:hypothetical protein